MPGREHDHRGVGGGRDVDLGLADPDRLDDDAFVAGSVEDANGLGRREGHAAEVSAGGHRPDEDAGVGGVLLHAHAIAQQRAAGVRRGRVDRQHRHGAGRASAAAPHQSGRERGLARPRARR